MRTPLTAVELELLQDSLQDRYELDLLKESLPPGRREEGARLLAELEQIHRALLVRRREVLERLSDRTSRALDQIARRLAILDEEYAFIRTHIFWVRDQEPIGAGTMAQGCGSAGTSSVPWPAWRGRRADDATGAAPRRSSWRRPWRRSACRSGWSASVA